MSELQQVPTEQSKVDDPVKAEGLNAGSGQPGSPPQANSASSGRPPEDDPDIHLSRLLISSDVEKPWFLSIIPAIKDLINPPKLPPLEITSKPVEVKNEYGLYAGNESKAGITSLLIHISVIALLVWLSTLKPVQKLIQDNVVPLFAPDLKPYVATVKKDKGGGGGGGGNRSPLDASKGKLPKPDRKQFTPPRVDPIDNPHLPMTPTVVAPDDVPNIQANNFGDPLSHLGIPSNGGGFGGGIGSGGGGGVGSGKGPGVVGPGTGGRIRWRSVPHRGGGNSRPQRAGEGGT